MEFPGGSAGLGSGAVTAVALVIVVVCIQSLAWEFPYAIVMDKKNEQTTAKNVSIKKKKVKKTFLWSSHCGAANNGNQGCGFHPWVKHPGLP